jgi:dihydrofolate synthase/folylpolyglutamate synthase
LRRLGSPHGAFRALHVAGTRGKGSTCALLSSALSEAGYRVGLTTSPHLASPCERVRFGLEAIDEERLMSLASSVRDASTGLDPGYFEVMTVAAFLAFAESAVDIAVVEVGLGGRLDATNVVIPWVTGISRLGMDHQDRLGATRAAIAREKAGILKAGVPAVLAPNEHEASSAVIECAREVGAPLRCLSDEDARSAAPTSLPGAMQAENAALAAAMLDELSAASGERIVVPDEALRRGFLSTRWPARLELREAALSRAPRIDLLLDVAHDVDSVEALCAHAKTLARPCVLIFSCLREKDLAGIARVIAASEALSAARIVVPELVSSRARTAADVVAALSTQGLAAARAESVASAIDIARELASGEARRCAPAAAPAPLVIAFGSFVLASEVMRALEPMRP